MITLSTISNQVNMIKFIVPNMHLVERAAINMLIWYVKMQLLLHFFCKKPILLVFVVHVKFGTDDGDIVNEVK